MVLQAGVTVHACATLGLLMAEVRPNSSMSQSMPSRQTTDAPSIAATT